jgi:hypothetical protein
MARQPARQMSLPAGSHLVRYAILADDLAAFASHSEVGSAAKPPRFVGGGHRCIKWVAYLDNPSTPAVWGDVENLEVAHLDLRYLIKLKLILLMQ